MRPSFYPRLINPPLDDPGVIVGFQFGHRALLFDAGDNSSLPPRELLKVSHIFISHTHMDHFIGFDRILRLFLGRNARLEIFGPTGFLSNLEGKLASYTWNLVADYRGDFIIRATEVQPDSILTREYACRNGFKPSGSTEEKPFDGILVQEPALRIEAAILDHGGISCLAFSLCERFHVNIRKSILDEMGLPVGPWLNGFKDALFNQSPPETVIEVPGPQGHSPRQLSLGELSSRIAHISAGQKIAYVADASPTPKNEDAILSLAEASDHLFMEAAFLEQDLDQALAKHHLTARRAGLLARRAGVGQLTVFHFSPRYTDHPHLLESEAQAAFRGGLST